MKDLYSRPMFRGSYLPPQIELGFMLHIFGKPRLSIFQWFLHIVIPMFLEKVMAIFVTVRDTEKLKTDEEVIALDDQRRRGRKSPLVVRPTPAHDHQRPTCSTVLQLDFFLVFVP